MANVNLQNVNAMISYSTTLRANPTDPEAAKKAYAQAQVNQTLTLAQFAEHIADHHSKYGQGDIYCILTEMVGCMREQFLLGNKIQLGDLGNFYVSLSSKGATSLADFTSNNIKTVRINWERGTKFKNLIDDAQFTEVLTRKEQAAALKDSKATA